MLASEPPRDGAAHLIVRAWEDLSTVRSVGLALGPIPVTAIWAWCDRRGLDADTAEVVEHVIRTLDVDRSEREAAERALEDQSRARRAGKR